MKALSFLTHKIILLLFCAGMLLILTSCGSIDDDLEKKANVDRKVASEVVNEKYKFLSVEHHDDERPKRDVYTYQSKERDMTFKVVSTLRPFGLDASILGYKKSVDVQYVEAVRNQYEDRMEEILKDFDRDHRDCLIYNSFDDLEGIANAIEQLNELYKEELTYNTQEWMIQNPLCKISFCYERVENDGYYISVFKSSVDGTHTYEDIYPYITYKHAEAVKNGIIADDGTTPEEQLARVHPANLENVFYKGVNLSTISREKAFKDGLKNNIESAYYSYYYYPWDTYLIVLDCGLTDDEYAPKWIECYADAFGFDCNIQYKKGKASWTYEGSSYEMIAKEEGRNHISDFKIYKDGRDLEIPYIVYDDYLSPVGATYVVGIPVDAFAELFHKDYEIREEGKSIEYIDC